jgi:hypothetical protein
MIIGCVRFDTKQVLAARRGRITQLRTPATRYDPDAHGRALTKAAKAQPGDLFWLAEAHVIYTPRSGSGAALVFPADFDHGTPRPPKWMGAVDSASGGQVMARLRTRRCPAHTLARSQSARTLVVVSCRLERLQEISAADAEAGGAEMYMSGGRSFYRMLNDIGSQGQTPQAAYLAWWTRLYGKDTAARDPEVAAITFRLIEENVDSYAARLAVERAA